MLTPNLLLFYVKSPETSAQFYQTLFDCKPSAVLPTYAAFDFENGLSLGLWSEEARNFVSGGNGHRSELSLMVPEDNEVIRLYEQWQQLNVTIEQPLHEAVFGLTFVALDPDGHRIRVCTPDD
ncbi:VOC family protein [Photobacterium sp. 1_MG-2023]|uniref:VOC family protein n=1 Tax=Photobacterium sp. 1_MG-2023 TaxID=3062646 RepID=UPI0026E46E7F|nr:VOC family protein [Photobacterium sp. 1_MG-2023]MDO6708343.1 VOC family protein [Photobacterium sp. 1_MG-2023]